MLARRTALALAAGALVGVFAMSGCGAATTKPPSSPEKLGVAATTTQLGDFARNLGGERVAVTQILKANVDPHDYEPTPADLTAIGKAKVVLRNGVGLDHWLDDTVTAAGFTGPVVDASKGVSIHPGDEAAGKDGDPHIWQNPLNAKIMSANIAAAFAAADSANAGYYQENLKTYQAKLDKLDQDIMAKLGTIAVGQRKLVTNHDAFGYYVQRYQLEFVGSIIPSFDTSAELSGTQIEDLVAKIKATGVRAIFSESSLPPKTAETIATQAGVTVEAGEDSLYSDTLGPDGSSGATYIDALTHNTDVIVRALRGSA